MCPSICCILFVQWKCYYTQQRLLQTISWCGVMELWLHILFLGMPTFMYKYSLSACIQRSCRYTASCIKLASYYNGYISRILTGIYFSRKDHFSSWESSCWSPESLSMLSLFKHLLPPLLRLVINYVMHASHSSII